MRITINLEDDSNSVKSATLDVADHENMDAIAFKAASQLGIPPSEVLEGLGTDDTAFTKHDTAAECARHGHKWHCRRRQTCVEVHYQSEEPARHFFNPKSPWRVVHEWACRHFKVAASMCRDLELFAGAPTGSPLNENLPIGTSQDCKIVWLAKPGPEPNG